MSQAKIDEYKKEKANRKANVKKAKAKKKLTLISSITAGVVVIGLLVWGIVATVQDGGLSKIKEQQEAAQQQQLVTQEFIDYLNSSQGSDSTSEDTDVVEDSDATDDASTETE